MIGLKVDLIMEKVRRAIDAENAMKSALEQLERLAELEELESACNILQGIQDHLRKVYNEYTLFMSAMERDIKL